MDTTLRLGITDKVSAINSILSSIGMVGINSEEDIDYNVDAGDADKLIDNLSQSVQVHLGNGLWFNREGFHKFTPEVGTGKVRVPNNTMSCKIKRSPDNTVTPVGIRGSLLFDAQVNGYDMSNSVWPDGLLHCELVVNLPFEALPTSAKHVIVDQARYWMVNDKEGDTVKLGTLERKMSASMITMLAEDTGQKRHNAFNNPYVSHVMNRVGGYNNN